MATKNNKQQPVEANLLTRTLGSNWFFTIIIAFFLFQTIWIALSTIYPMIFDEEYHLGVIDIYSRQISPFVTTQPAEAAFHGDITRYGSYLFHYLMSFPYSIISHFTNDLQTTIILMRLICIGFVVGGLLIFRKFLLRAGVTKSLTHLAIGIFTLIPLVPFASSQINYDSLAFLMVATIFYLTIRAIERSKHHIIWLMLLLSVSALSCLVKFTILPIAFSCILFVGVILLRRHGKKVGPILLQEYKKLAKPLLIVLTLLFIISLGMFTERYGVNLIQYHAIEPKCDRIHSAEVCIQYAVWRRDITWKQINDTIGLKRDNPVQYSTTYWVPHILGDFFVVGSPVYNHDQPLQIRYLPVTVQAATSNAILRYGGLTLLGLALVVLVITWRKLPNRKLRYLVMLTVLIYTISLWVQNYSAYLNIGAGVAAQGRYLIPLMIPILAIIGLAFRRLLGRMRYQVAFLVICLMLLSQGGGVANYILFSNSRWYWVENRQTITNTNQSARQFLRLFIPT